MMLLPTKHMNIKCSVLYIAGMLLLFLKDNEIMEYDVLKEKTIHELGKWSKGNINNALTFLYALGKIEYVQRLDAIKLIDK